MIPSTVTPIDERQRVLSCCARPDEARRLAARFYRRAEKIEAWTVRLSWDQRRKIEELRLCAALLNTLADGGLRLENP